jgi:hypothetical protein
MRTLATTVVTVPKAANGSTLKKLGVTFDPKLHQLQLTPAAVGVSIFGLSERDAWVGRALKARAVRLHVNAKTAGKIKLYSHTPISVTIVQLGG